MVIPYMLLVRVDTVVAKTGGVVLMNDQQIGRPLYWLITGEWYSKLVTHHQTLIFYTVVMTYAVYISE